MATGDIVELTFDWDVLNDMSLSHARLQNMAIDGGEFLWEGRGYRVREVIKMLATCQSRIRCVDMGDAEELRARHRAERQAVRARIAASGGIDPLVSYAPDPAPLPDASPAAQRAIDMLAESARRKAEEARKKAKPPVVVNKIKADPLVSTQRQIDVDWD